MSADIAQSILKGCRPNRHLKNNHFHNDAPFFDRRSLMKLKHTKGRRFTVLRVSPPSYLPVVTTYQQNNCILPLKPNYPPSVDWRVALRIEAPHSKNADLPWHPGPMGHTTSCRSARPFSGPHTSPQVLRFYELYGTEYLSTQTQLLGLPSRSMNQAHSCARGHHLT